MIFNQRSRPVLLLTSCLSVGYLVAVYPLPDGYAFLRPELLCLLVIYWVMNSPQHLGMVFAWGVGLLQDILELGVWGAHALALTVIAYICLMSYQRIRSYSVWHQTLWVIVLVGLHQLIVNWVDRIAGYHSPPQELIVPAVVSALCWPPTLFLFKRVRLRYRIT